MHSMRRSRPDCVSRYECDVLRHAYFLGFVIAFLDSSTSERSFFAPGGRPRGWLSLSGLMVSSRRISSGAQWRG